LTKNTYFQEGIGPEVIWLTYPALSG